ncbi:MAG: hypothetical protein ACRDV0_03955 [Acidimicrobiales bacterium]
MVSALLFSSLGWLAVAAGFVGALAQWRRVSREGVAGVSLATWTLFSLMGLFWICYGVSAHSPEVVLGSVSLLPLQVAIVVRLRPWDLGVLARSLAFVAACCVVPTFLFGWVGGVIGVGVAMTANRVPQFVELVREDDASGVSAASWFLGVVGAGLWVLYYSGARLWAALASTAAAGLANLSIALLATWRHRRSRQRLVADEVFAA